MKHTKTLFVLLLVLGFVGCGDSREEKANSGDLDAMLEMVEEGNPTAEYNVALIYEKGEGVIPNDKEAVRLYHLAAAKGHPSAQHNLALRYLDGRGVSKDETRAFELLTKAADYGSALSQGAVGYLYEEGTGTVQSDMLAYVYYATAATTGEPVAVEARDRLTSSLSADDLEKAQALARQMLEGFGSLSQDEVIEKYNQSLLFRHPK